MNCTYERDVGRDKVRTVVNRVYVVQVRQTGEVMVQGPIPAQGKRVQGRRIVSLNRSAYEGIHLDSFLIFGLRHVDLTSGRLRTVRLVHPERMAEFDNGDGMQDAVLTSRRGVGLDVLRRI